MSRWQNPPSLRVALWIFAATLTLVSGFQCSQAYHQRDLLIEQQEQLIQSNIQIDQMRKRLIHSYEQLEQAAGRGNQQAKQLVDFMKQRGFKTSSSDE